METTLIISLGALVVSVGALIVSMRWKDKETRELRGAIAQIADPLIGTQRDLINSLDRLSHSISESGTQVETRIEPVPRREQRGTAFFVSSSPSIEELTQTNDFLLREDGKSELNEFLLSEWALKAHIKKFEEELFDPDLSPEEFLRKYGLTEPSKMDRFLKALSDIREVGWEKTKEVASKTFKTINSFGQKAVGTILGGGKSKDGGDDE